MNHYLLHFLLVIVIFNSCTDPNNLGLEVQPESDIITFNVTENFTWQEGFTISEDSLPSDETLSLLLGKINDPIFGENSAEFITQILLSANNNIIGENPEVDSVILSYSYSGYYGELEDFSSVNVQEIDFDIFKDSVYYSNSFNLENTNSLVNTFAIKKENESPFLKISLKNTFGQKILDFGETTLQDNDAFLQNFRGLHVTANSQNTILYLNPSGLNTKLVIYYHNSSQDSLELEFQLDNNTARVNLFNDKSDFSLLNDQSYKYIQSMAGYKLLVNINGLDSIKKVLSGKSINKATMTFTIADDSQIDYPAHEKLLLVRLDDEDRNIFLTDYIIEGESYFGGILQDGEYNFNITRYLYQLINNNSYTNKLYLLPTGSTVNANRSILNNDVQLTIHFSEL
mgnify:FL=1